MSILGTDVREFAASWKLQRSFNWELILPDIYGFPGFEVSKYCQSVSFGQYDMAELDEVRYGAFKRKYAGQLTVDELVVTMLIPVPDIVGEYFQLWRELVIDRVGFYLPKIAYAKDARLVMYDRDGNTSSQYRFSGVFPKTLPKFQLDYGTEEIAKVEVTLNVDRVTKEE